ncbi:hypothetical protein AVEN_104665-1 [Araneus ventricosus]|uniref:Uncharacterized protein n=1 Tax=Araneus ventricosus TaxID=182803 RepID=A0A4Y2BBN8_ARAVE|nr:hypothetical protein AVEN_104665-1 [Araneus ventricosus]
MVRRRRLSIPPTRRTEISPGSDMDDFSLLPFILGFPGIDEQSTPTAGSLITGYYSTNSCERNSDVIRMLAQVRGKLTLLVSARSSYIIRRKLGLKQPLLLYASAIICK